MIRKALKEICRISTDENINTENYIDAINFIDNLYHTVYILKQNISIKKLQFLPSFKGKYICERLGLPSIPEENELKVLKVTAEQFRVDKELQNTITDDMKKICAEITLIDNTFIFKLK